jgi:putative addiction module component (TIGR02574 family)
MAGSSRPRYIEQEPAGTRKEVTFMATKALDKCERQAKGLPLADRALLIEHLIGSLDQLDEEECERLWIAEAERRYAGYRAGDISARPASDVFRGARARLASLK